MYDGIDDWNLPGYNAITGESTMKVRPTIKIGDMVKRKKPHDSGLMFRVVQISVDPVDLRKYLGRWEARRVRPGQIRHMGHEGFAWIHIQGKSGETWKVRRRDLWRVPNQPRDKKKFMQHQATTTGRP